MLGKLLSLLLLAQLATSQGMLQFTQNLHLFAPPDGKLFLFQSDFFDNTQSLTGLDYKYPDATPTVAVSEAVFAFDVNKFAASFSDSIDFASQNFTIASTSVPIGAIDVEFTYQCTGASSSMKSTSAVNVTNIQYLVKWSSDSTSQVPVMAPTIQNFQLVIVSIGDDVKCAPDKAGLSTYLSQKLQEKVQGTWDTIVPTFKGRNFNKEYSWTIHNTAGSYDDHYTMDLTFSNVMAPILDTMPVSYNYLYSITWSAQQTESKRSEVNVEIPKKVQSKSTSPINGAADECAVIPSDLLWNITSQVFINQMTTQLTINQSNAPFSMPTFPVPILQLRQLLLVAPSLDISNSPKDAISFTCKFIDFDRTFNSFKYNVSMSCNVMHKTQILWVSEFDIQGDFTFRIVRQQNKCNGKYMFQTLMFYPQMIMKSDDKTTQQQVDKNVIQRWQAKIVESFFQKWLQEGNENSNFMSSCWNFLVEFNRDGDNSATLNVDSSGATLCYDVDYSPQTKEI